MRDLPRLNRLGKALQGIPWSEPGYVFKRLMAHVRARGADAVLGFLLRRRRLQLEPEAVGTGQLALTEHVPVAIPVSTGDSDPPPDHEEIAVPTTRIVDDVVIVGPNRTPFQRDVLLQTAVNSPNYQGPGWHLSSPALIKVGFHATGNPTTRLERAVVLANGWSTNYFHWVSEQLPRLFAPDGPVVDDVGVGVVVSPHPPRWVGDSLRMVGVADERVIDDTGDLAVAELLNPPFPRQMVLGRRRSAVSPYMLGEMRRRVVSVFPAVGEPTNVLISRRNAVGRRISNEEELEGALLPLGFEVVCLEDLTFAQQVELFHRARIVVGPHGAGLTNMVFSTSSVVLEISGPDSNRSFITLSAALGHSHHVVDAQPIGNGKRADLVVDVSRVRRLVEEACEGRPR